jgi:proteasome activator subunit 4
MSAQVMWLIQSHNGIELTHLTKWRPAYSSAKALLENCGPDRDPFHVRDSTHMSRILNLVERFPKWKAERLPGARVSHSTYDKVGLTGT